jgi:hypothetical protein
MDRPAEDGTGSSNGEKKSQGEIGCSINYLNYYFCILILIADNNS